MVSSRNNKLDCYKGLVKYFDELLKASVEVSVHWGDEEAKLVRKLVNQIMELDFEFPITIQKILLVIKSVEIKSLLLAISA